MKSYLCLLVFSSQTSEMGLPGVTAAAVSLGQHDR